MLILDKQWLLQKVLGMDVQLSGKILKSIQIILIKPTILDIFLLFFRNLSLEGLFAPSPTNDHFAF